MEEVERTHKKASKFASEDVICNMPENVITNILNHLPIRDAVRTSVLARNWRFKWTMLTQLVIKCRFSKYGRDLSRLLLHLKGPITKFVLYIPDYMVLDGEDINHWIAFLSRKGIEKFTLLNFRRTQFKLHTHLFSCLDLKHLRLQNCCFHVPPSFHGFPNLLSLNLYDVRFESGDYGEFITSCPLLEVLGIGNDEDPMRKMRLVEIAELKNLKTLSLSLCNLYNLTITSYTIFKLAGYFSKLQELYLNFSKCNFIREQGARKFSIAFPHLKTLELYEIDLSSGDMLSCAIEMMRGSPNLKSLKIEAPYEDDVPTHALDTSEIDYNTVGQLQLRSVVFECFNGSENEMCLIKYLLASSPFLEYITVETNIGKLPFAKKLLELHRASPVAEVYIF
ncbi:putative F-box domain, leucine-rich repeat domain superfamily, F-box-like domain superfamily [Helianthus annuus]|uniref:F-box domain, leucine-rich repeat domain superfamily, F-box-like domain superfamily n=1 Tax=Helianthus annuus TaxID=4232 RepID=A0A9K3DV30_HELAN|nr:F-box/FBD/LRR-repeat protein At1g13570-like [Helianthus annuus]KAF5762046.1 putative F-box domain, leucine-rich repeat domain superfamily, F-box-like domain superfamily [Helianthus annuus]KAJ0462193.1 putative F-box domain, leucine-rich repeat domain superfamily, F-box-like domain superfamily [Helianthus annuus]